MKNLVREKKIFAPKAYSSSPNLNKLSSYKPTSPTMDHPIGTKATKRATKAKSKAKSSNFLDLKGMEEIIKTKTKTLENLACAKHEINKVKIKGSR